MNEESQAAPIDETSWILQVEKIAEEVALREGCILYDVEFLGGRILRISIDKDIISHNVMHDPAAQAAVDSQPDIQSLIHDENSGEVEELSGDSEAGLGTGVGIKDCSRVANGLNELVNLDDLVPGGNYNLEVSTPGVDRQLKKLWHYEKVIGQRIWVKTREAFESYHVTHAPLMKAKQVEGVLLSVKDGQILLEVPKSQISLPLSVIEKAHVVFEMKSETKKKKR